MLNVLNSTGRYSYPDVTGLRDVLRKCLKDLNFLIKLLEKSPKIF